MSMFSVAWVNRMTITSSSVSSLSSVIFSQQVSAWLRAIGGLKTVCILTAALLVGLGAKAVGQTAHFSRAQVTIGGAAFNAPIDLAFDRNGNLFIAEYDGTAIDEIEAVNGVIPTLATVRRLATGLPLLPVGVAVDASGSVFVSEGFSNTVR